MTAISVLKHWLGITFVVACLGIAVAGSIVGWMEHKSAVSAEKKAAACDAAVTLAQTTAVKKQKTLDQQAIQQARAIAQTQADTAAAAHADLAQTHKTVATLNEELQHAYDHATQAQRDCADSRPPIGVQHAAADALRAASRRRPSDAHGSVQPGAESTIALPATGSSSPAGAGGG